MFFFPSYLATLKWCDMFQASLHELYTIVCKLKEIAPEKVCFFLKLGHYLVLFHVTKQSFLKMRQNLYPSYHFLDCTGTHLGLF